MNSVLFFSDDLMFSSKIAGAVANSGAQMRCISTMSGLIDQLTATPAAAVIVDLSCAAADPAAVVAAVKKIPGHGKVAAFGAHVQAGKLIAAEAAGCDLVITRGQFNAQVEQVVASLRAD